MRGKKVEPEFVHYYDYFGRVEAKGKKNIGLWGRNRKCGASRIYQSRIFFRAQPLIP